MPKKARSPSRKKASNRASTRTRSSRSAPASKSTDEIVFVESLADLEKYGPSGPPPDHTFFLPMRLFASRFAGGLDRPYAQNVWVYAANQAIAIPISSLPFVLFREQKRSRQLDMKRRALALKEVLPSLQDRWAMSIAFLESPRQRFEAIRSMAPWLTPYELQMAATGIDVVQDGPWVELFTSVNPEMTRSVLWESTFVFLGTGGDCFWELAGRNGKVEPTEIPQRIWPRSREGWKPTHDKERGIVNGWKFEGMNFEGKPIREEFELFQIVHFKYFNPHNPHFGQSQIQAAEEEIEQYFRSGRWNTKFFQNGATPGGFLVFKEGLTPDQEEKLTKELEQRHQGENKAHRLGLLKGDVTWQESKMHQRDMQFIQMRDKSRDAVMAAHRISKSALGMVEDQNRANLMSADRQHWQGTLLPKAHYIEDLLRSDLFTPERTKGAPIFGGFDLSRVEALREDLTLKLEAAETFMKIGYTTNQINERLGLAMPEVPWGDRWYAPISLIPVGGDGDGGPAADDEEERALRLMARRFLHVIGSERGTPAALPPGQSLLPEGSTPEGSTAEVKPQIIHTARESKFKTKEHWSALIRDIFEPSEKKYTRKYRGFLKKVRGVQLAILGDADFAQVHVADQVLFDASEMKVELRGRVTPVYRQIFDLAAREMEQEIEALGRNAARRQADFVVEQFIDTLLFDVDKTVDTIRKRLRAIIAVALTEKKTLEETQDDVRAAFNILEDERAPKIAQNETSATVNGARFLTMDELEVEFEDWLTAGDLLVRDNHVIYGASGPQERGFNYAELVGQSYTLKYPQDSRAPREERIGCRCVLVPV